MTTGMTSTLFKFQTGLLLNCGDGNVFIMDGEVVKINTLYLQ